VLSDVKIDSLEMQINLRQVRFASVFTNKSISKFDAINLVFEGGGVEEELIKALRVAADELEETLKKKKS